MDAKQAAIDLVALTLVVNELHINAPEDQDQAYAEYVKDVVALGDKIRPFVQDEMNLNDIVVMLSEKYAD